MENNLLVQLVINSKQGDKDALTILINKFLPLLKKYAYKLNYEDALDELILFFIETTKRINISGFLKENGDNYLISYLNQCVKNKYILLSKQLSRYSSNIVDIEIENIDYSLENCYSSIEYIMIINTLTELQKKIIILSYFYGYSNNEIALILKSTRQAVNQCKNRA